MTVARIRGRRLAGRVAAAILIVSVAAGPAPSSAAAATGGDPSGPPTDTGSVSLERDWHWPVRPFRLERAFVAPPHEYGPGHRGVDLSPLGEDVVHAPAAGVVAFSGQVAGRGILTIDHGEGLVSTLEPVQSDLLPGTRVAPDAPVARLSAGGHAAPGLLHFGVRLDGEYINPLTLLGGVPRAILLPCC